MLSGPPLILDGSESGQEMYWETKESVKASAEEKARGWKDVREGSSLE